MRSTAGTILARNSLQYGGSEFSTRKRRTKRNAEINDQRRYPHAFPGGKFSLFHFDIEQFRKDLKDPQFCQSREALSKLLNLQRTVGP